MLSYLRSSPIHNVISLLSRLYENSPESFVNTWPNSILNIHPSLLPSFPGTKTHERALEAGVKVSGCTLHFVTAELDAGPIIGQAVVPVLDNDTPKT
ncbi:MAG: hypothetical protein CM15mP14_4200 [Rhodospirillaceae bacterium]|nr:MAG: hypothetical protein CM15mP14_4200 [Rhodospirillaceae bacterium]